jgi:glycosyltransferase involved in cell wall biosynthesis
VSPPLVSILVPCHNAAPWLAATLESALAQTWPHCEIIVVDDGSTDNSTAVARRYAPAGVRLAMQPRSGAAAARNRALRETCGDFIQFLDADDLLSAGKIASQVNLLTARPPGALASCAWGRFTTDISTARFVDTSVFRDFAPIDFLLLAGETGAMMHPAAWLVPRAIAERAGPWNETLSLNDDGEYFCRVALAASEIAYCTDPVAKSFYRSGLPGTLSQRRDERARRSQFRALELITRSLLTAEDSARTCSACAGYWRRFVHDYYPVPRDLITRAQAEVLRLGSELGQPPMGPKSRWLARLIGWRNVWRLKHLLNG